MKVPFVGNTGRYYCRGGDGILREHYLPGGQIPRGAAPADQWDELCETAHTTAHLEIKPSDLNGCLLGGAFVKCVINDPRVQAFGKLLCLEYQEFQSLFRDGLFPTPQGKSPFGPFVVVGGDKWPVALDATTTLSWDFARVASRGECHDYPPAPEKKWNSFFHTSSAIADRANAFFELLRGTDLIVSGLTDDFTSKTIPNDHWTRPDRYLDVKLNDLLSIEPETRPRLLLTGVKATALDLHAEIGRSIESVQRAVDARDGLMLWLRDKRKSTDFISQRELEVRIDPVWLRAHGIVDGEYASTFLTKMAENKWSPYPPERSPSAAPLSSENEAAIKEVRYFKGFALDDKIRDAIRTAIREQESRGGKKLHVREQRAAAMKILEDGGIRPEVGGLQKQVEHILKEPEFVKARGRRGVRINITSRTAKP